jgi:hypothetical protein
MVLAREQFMFMWRVLLRDDDSVERRFQPVHLLVHVLEKG